MRIVVFILALFCLLTLVNCEITLDPPDTDFFLTKTWRIADLKNGEISETEPGQENYRLTLVEDGSLKLVDFDEQEYDGSWRLNSTNSVLETIYFDYPDPNSPDKIKIPEVLFRWTLIEISVRNFRANQELSLGKPGKYTRTYFFEAVPQ